MRRRSFLSRLLSALCVTPLAATQLPATQQVFDGVIGSKPRPPLQIQCDRSNGVATLQGDPADVAAFCEQYQLALWPNWLQHPQSYLAKRYLDAARPDWAAGRGAVLVRYFEHRMAFNQVIKAWAGPLVIV